MEKVVWTPVGGEEMVVVAPHPTLPGLAAEFAVAGKAVYRLTECFCAKCLQVQLLAHFERAT